MFLSKMARLSFQSLGFYSRHIRNKVPMRHISTTRRLLSQEWQQEGVPGSTLPFPIKNKYIFTLMMFIYAASGFNAPFVIMAFQFMRQNETTETIVEQQLTLFGDEDCKEE